MRVDTVCIVSIVSGAEADTNTVSTLCISSLADCRLPSVCIPSKAPPSYCFNYDPSIAHRRRTKGSQDRSLCEAEGLLPSPRPRPLPLAFLAPSSSSHPIPHPFPEPLSPHLIHESPSQSTPPPHYSLPTPPPICPAAARSVDPHTCFTCPPAVVSGDCVERLEESDVDTAGSLLPAE